MEKKFMIDNTYLTHLIEAQLHYKPNTKDTSYYKVFRNANLTHQIRVSNHGTYLRTWIDKDYDPSISTNISIVFTKNGVPTNDCLIDSQTNEPFKDCAPCIDQQIQSQQPCKPRQVAGISNILLNALCSTGKQKYKKDFNYPNFKP